MGVVALAAACGSDPAPSAASDSAATAKPAGDSTTDNGSKSDTTGDNGAADIDPASLSGFASLHPQGDAKTYYTGYDGKNDYVAPIAFYADTPPKVTLSDSSVATMQGTPMTITKVMDPSLPDALDGKLQVILIKSKAAGTVTITATSGSLTQKATLKITKYSSTDVSVGQKRYENGSPSCNSCHATLGVHNPGMLVDLSDDTILGIATDGKSLQQINQDTGKVETVQPNNGNHKWTVTTAERTGLMAYLRSRDLTYQLQLP
jgi:hypothetical protein